MGTTVGKLEIDYTVELFQPTPQTEIGAFNSYSSKDNQPPFTEQELIYMAESLDIVQNDKIKASRPGTYYFDFFQSGSGDGLITSTVNGLLELMDAAGGTSSWAGRYRWTVSTAQAIQGAYLTLNKPADCSTTISVSKAPYTGD